jgi:hypothetical protein
MLDKYEKYGKLPGKLVGNNIYFHKSLVGALPEELYHEINKLDALFFDNRWGYGYNIIKIDMNKDVVSFINSIEFDLVDEPRIDNVYLIKDNKLDKVLSYTHHKNIPVYHHKWMLVSNHYKGFNVEKSKRRSVWWENHPVVLKRKQEDKYFKSKIGMSNYWNNLLQEMNEYDTYSTIERNGFFILHTWRDVKL